MKLASRNGGNAARGSTAAFDGCLVDGTREAADGGPITFSRDSSRTPSATSVSRGRRRDVRRRASSAIGERNGGAWLRSESSFLSLPFALRTVTHGVARRRPGVSAHARRTRYPTECLVRTRSGLRRSPPPTPLRQTPRDGAFVPRFSSLFSSFADKLSS